MIIRFDLILLWIIFKVVVIPFYLNNFTGTLVGVNFIFLSIFDQKNN